MPLDNVVEIQFLLFLPLIHITLHWCHLGDHASHIFVHCIVCSPDCVGKHQRKHQNSWPSSCRPIKQKKKCTGWLCSADWESNAITTGMISMNKNISELYYVIHSYIRQWIGTALVQIMACCLFGAKPLSRPMLGYCHSNPKKLTSVKFWPKYKTFHSRKCIWKYRLWNGGHFVQVEMS